MPRVQGQELLELPREEVWRRLNDPDALGSSIPGCRGFERDAGSDQRFRTSITVAVGAVKGTYDGAVEYRDVVEPERCTIFVSGKGDKGAIEGEGRIVLSGKGEATEVGYEGTFKITGRVAGVGQRLAPGVSRKMIVETLRNLERRGRAAAPAAPEREPEQPATAERESEQPGTAEHRSAQTAVRAEPEAARPTPASAEPEAFRPLQAPPLAIFLAGCAVGVAVVLILTAIT